MCRAISLVLRTREISQHKHNSCVLPILIKHKIVSWGKAFHLSITLIVKRVFLTSVHAQGLNSFFVLPLVVVVEGWKKSSLFNLYLSLIILKVSLVNFLPSKQANGSTFVMHSFSCLMCTLLSSMMSLYPHILN